MKNKLWLLCLPLLCVSCSDDEVITPTSTETQEVPVANVVCTIGKKIDDPYNIDNMRKAYRKLYASNNGVTHESEIQPTHKYLRFLPKDEEEYNMLRNDTTIEWFDYPLHYEAPDGMGSYHDPAIPADKPTYQYCVLPIDKAEPNVYYELIYECYFPDTEEKENDGKLYAAKKHSVKFNQSLELEALKLTNHLPQNYTLDSLNALEASRFTPYGYIMLYDNYLKREVPLRHVKVKIQTATRYETLWTDKNGYYKSKNNYQLKASRKVVWEASEWDIRDGATSQASYTSSSSKNERWDWHISDTCKNKPHCHYAYTHRALMQTIDRGNEHLDLPDFGGKLKIRVIDDKNPEKALGTTKARRVRWGEWSIGSDIKLWTYYDGSNPKSRIDPVEFISTTCHELGHAIHASKVSKDVFKAQRCDITEAWAELIGWYMTRAEYNYYYSEFPNDGYSYLSETDFYPNRIMIGWPYDYTKDSTDINYSPVFVDLMDEINQQKSYILTYSIYTSNNLTSS